MIKTWLSHGFDKNVGSSVCPEKTKDEYELFLAKNESEGLHLSLLSDNDVDGVRVEIAGGHSGVSVKTFYETFIPVRDEVYPDPLVPYTEPQSLIAGRPLNVYIEFSSSISAQAGQSVFTVKARTSDTVIRSYTVNVKVWDFALPETPSCETAIGLLTTHLCRFHDLSTEEEKLAMYKKYYDVLLDHKMSAYTLPYDILDPRADAYMSDPRVTTFCCNLHLGEYNNLEYDQVEKAGKKLVSNPQWVHKAYSYPLDEPTTMEHLKNLKERSERLREAYPAVHTVSPFYSDIDVDESTDQFEYMAGINDILCPKAVLFEEIYTEEQKKKYPPVYDRMMKYKENGHRIWWYVCNYPQPPYFNVFTNDVGLNSRALFWLQYRYGATGFLYWCSNCWLSMADPWENTDTFGNDIHGDGILFYPGSKIGYDGPITSLRMKIIRDGIEDFDLLTLAEEALGKDYVAEMIASVATCQTEVKVDGDGFHKIRAEIGNAIERSQKQQMGE